MVLDEKTVRIVVVLYVLLFGGFWFYFVSKKGWKLEWGFLAAGLAAGTITFTALGVLRYVETGSF